MGIEKYKILPSRLAGSGANDYDVFRFDDDDNKQIICFLQEDEDEDITCYDIKLIDYILVEECMREPEFARWLYYTVLTLNSVAQGRKRNDIQRL